MLYELIGVVRPSRLNEVKEIAKRSGSIILGSGGVVRGYTNWGTFLLPKPLRKKDQGLFNRGHYFIMRFDSSAKAQHSMKRTLSNDPRLIRYSVVKLGNKLDEIADVGGTAPERAEGSMDFRK
ncbi:37S ribosomal protein Mrp17 [Eremomyces bilateralis CBS 781.70]|uniref:Small ribosomal subunit protein bS6m n=1 Tax=Eremomyces bilateralis CBS 781.70 TaxID=1392243 RepID=A0A6G1GAF1_9PEZI|nr:37S ribosomal protein Mrp17 [Eremomyces bilateralis CBS 781.70]KAF1815067.1 37S ribosomal protein Mrp17 [Eremomyces bilateralis CBS 781.70]